MSSTIIVPQLHWYLQIQVNVYGGLLLPPHAVESPQLPPIFPHLLCLHLSPTHDHCDDTSVLHEATEPSSEIANDDGQEGCPNDFTSTTGF